MASFRKIQGLPISKIVRTADSTVIIITDFYLAASSHEIFLKVRGREGMKGLGALQRHQLPQPPLAKILDPPLPIRRLKSLFVTPKAKNMLGHRTIR